MYKNKLKQIPATYKVIIKKYFFQSTAKIYDKFTCNTEKIVVFAKRRFSCYKNNKKPICSLLNNIFVVSQNVLL